MEVGIIGAGIVGSTFAIKLKQKGNHIKFIANRTPEKAEHLAKLTGARVAPVPQVIESCPTIFITTPDKEISPLAQQFARYFHQDQLVVHCSGALSSTILKPASDQGARILSIHPLQSFASVDLALRGLSGTHFSIEGQAVDQGVEIVNQLGGIPHICASDNKALYHAGACIASNYLTVLMEISAKLLVLTGFTQDEAVKCLVPLMQGTLDNLRDIGLPKALTGPIARGDIKVVANHLAKMPEEYQEIYRLLGLRALALGEAKGTLDSTTSRELSELLHFRRKD